MGKHSSRLLDQHSSEKKRLILVVQHWMWGLGFNQASSIQVSTVSNNSRRMLSEK